MADSSLPSGVPDQPLEDGPLSWPDYAEWAVIPTGQIDGNSSLTPEGTS